MDQDSFRRLLQTPHSAVTPPNVGGFSKPKPKHIDASQPAFKPRKVKKTDNLNYRDRAAERRGGEAGDYAQVEAVLEDFEKRNANNQDKFAVEAQRKYLGGDSDHSVLVKGLDFALLEQNRARAAAASNNEDDDSLEKAFLEGSGSSTQPTDSTVPKKRTRAELIRELKEKRSGNDAESSEGPKQKSTEAEALLLEDAKKSGKFKPIGFKPVGSSNDAGKKKKGKGEAKDGERKKKKRKAAETAAPQEAEEKKEDLPPPAPFTPPASVFTPLSQPEALSDDFDIFAGAGDYEGMDLGDDDDDDDDDRPPRAQVTEEVEEPSSAAPPRRWIESDEPAFDKPKPSLLASVLKAREASPPIAPIPNKGTGRQDDEVDDDINEKETQQPIRLQPLESSALPSIKDFLAMDKAASGPGKRKNKKSRKKGDAEDEDKSQKKKQSTEAKIDRDYQRLKNYTEKKSGGR